MKGIIAGLNKVFDSRVRLGIMSILVLEDDVDFKQLKDLLEITDGNLASHLTALEKANYIEVIKSFVGRRPNTKYNVTAIGRKAFTDHLEFLEKLLKKK